MLANFQSKTSVGCAMHKMSTIVLTSHLEEVLDILDAVHNTFVGTLRPSWTRQTYFNNLNLRFFNPTVGQMLK